MTGFTGWPTKAFSACPVLGSYNLHCGEGKGSLCQLTNTGADDGAGRASQGKGRGISQKVLALIPASGHICRDS